MGVGWGAPGLSPAAGQTCHRRQYTPGAPPETRGRCVQGPGAVHTATLRKSRLWSQGAVALWGGAG